MESSGTLSERRASSILSSVWNWVSIMESKVSSGKGDLIVLMVRRSQSSRRLCPSSSKGWYTSGSRGAAGSPGLGESGAGWLAPASELAGELLPNKSPNKSVHLKPLPPAPSPDPEPEAPEGAIMLHDSEMLNLRDHAIARASAPEQPNPLRGKERAFPPREKPAFRERPNRPLQTLVEEIENRTEQARRSKKRLSQNRKGTQTRENSFLLEHVEYGRIRYDDQRGGVTAVVEIDEDLYSTKKGQAPKHRNDQREASADANKAKEQEGGDDTDLRDVTEVSRELTIDGLEGREREEGLAPYPKTLIQRRKWLSHNQLEHFGRSGSAGSNSNGDNMGGSGGSSRGSGWTHFDLDVLAENSAASAEDDRRGENRNSTSDPAEQRNGASSSHIFPYQADEVIGGDSVNAIKSRLLAKTPSPSFYEIEQARIDAQDRFEVKVEIIRQMAPLHPEGDWLGRGARALENPRTATGEHSLEKLHTLLSDLESRGVNSESFSQLKGKVPLRRGGDEHSTT
ncbi:hypothetical protein RND71_044215 [Anisodus tanguticus]|uniref:DUF8018 domain-containing protein n=1 Tax=Anisodus tanguticus TaxID=243964 RepID=A0AAE1UT89_9SOLA|nr:hypothetical protein RND71_044215 [Anisodus tanguticus]